MEEHSELRNMTCHCIGGVKNQFTPRRRNPDCSCL